MNLSIFSILYRLILYKEEVISHLFEHKDKYFLSFALFLIVIKGLCEYLSVLLITDFGELFQFFTLFSFGAFYIFYTCMIIFLKSSMVGFFRKGNDNRDIENHKIFIIIACSYYPFLFLPAAIVIVKGLLLWLSDNSFWTIPFFNDLAFPISLIMLFATYIWTAILRVRFFNKFSKNFYIQPMLLVFIPKIIEVCFIFVLMMLMFYFSSAVIAYIQKLLSNFINQVL